MHVNIKVLTQSFSIYTVRVAVEQESGRSVVSILWQHAQTHSPTSHLGAFYFANPPMGIVGGAVEPRGNPHVDTDAKQFIDNNSSSGSGNPVAVR